MSDLLSVSRKRHGDRRHAACLHDQQQRPAIQKRHGRMIGIPQIRILSAKIRPEHCQLGINKRTCQRSKATQYPRAQDQRVRVNLSRNNVGIDENSRTDDPAHHDHGRVKGADAPRERSFGNGRGRLTHSLAVSDTPAFRGSLLLCFFFSGLALRRLGGRFARQFAETLLQRLH